MPYLSRAMGKKAAQVSAFSVRNNTRLVKCRLCGKPFDGTRTAKNIGKNEYACNPTCK